MKMNMNIMVMMMMVAAVIIAEETIISVMEVIT